MKMKTAQTKAAARNAQATARTVTDDQVQEALSWLHPMLLTSLKKLASAPPSVVDAAIQIMPVASKIVLRQNGLAEYADDSSEACPSDQRPLKLTALGEEVIAAASVELMSVADWSKQAQARDAVTAAEVSKA